jgi:hypothetical protein
MESPMTTDEKIDQIAILIAEGNNGGSWATHYTEGQKALWRKRAWQIVEILTTTTPEQRMAALG